MKKLLYILFGFLFICNAYAAQIVNVEYIHNLISQEWDITVPYNPALTNVKTIANMKYLLTAVDVANEILNGEKTTDYGNTEFATTRIADTIATNQAAQTLIKEEIPYEFKLTTTSDTTSFSFKISAAGEFIVNWGDGKTETITKPDTTDTTYSHTYSTSKSHTIKLTGQATAYNDSTTTAAISFYVNSSQTKIASIDGSLGAIFGTLADETQPRFYQTFYNASNMTSSIPDGLFAGISGAPASSMFNSTFYGCSKLTSIPENLFAGISGKPASSMFYGTFFGCRGLTSIPENLFAGISGAPASGMFSYTFSGCRGLTSIPGNLFAGISGAPASNMFGNTFNGCTGLTSIPDGLFAGISGAPASYMFFHTFYGCSGLTSIPENLFAGISGAPASTMFYGTFYGCSGLTSIPENLFAGISGVPASYMFYVTFRGCTGLTSIPAGLFAGISGKPASDMFRETFYNCRGLTGAIPAGLFAGISGAPASGMFRNTFYGCSGLTSIPENLFGNISGTAQDYMFYQTFNNCTSLTGPSARINGQYLYEIWPSATSYEVDGMYDGATGLDDYRCIPTLWGGGGEDCSVTSAEFTLTTTPDTTSFSFKISAAGEFVVDWGDGTVETITKTNTTDTTYTHNYATADEYTIGLSGQATAYNTSTSTAAISFYVGSNTSAIKKIASIDGSLGAIFGTLADGTQPRFYQTFFDATNMTGSIPSDLFAGISGAPAVSMFDSTFYGCSGLTGAIPDGLFGNLTGAPASYMFQSTFSGCSGLTGAIPDGLFAGISGAPASYMFDSTFYGCSGLTSIPENLFGDISGTAQDGMFYGTFFKCTSLTGPSARINGQYLYEIWPDASFSNGAGSYVIGPYYQCTGLSDYNQIPNNWKVYVDNTGDF